MEARSLEQREGKSRRERSLASKKFALSLFFVLCQWVVDKRSEEPKYIYS
jgi:hypothetical protein